MIVLNLVALACAQNAGGCKLEDFSAELLTRQIKSERQCSASAPGLDSAPLH